MQGRPDSVVRSMRRAIADLALELLKEEKVAEVRKYQKVDKEKADAARDKEARNYPEGNIFAFVLLFFFDLIPN